MELDLSVLRENFGDDLNVMFLELRALFGESSAKEVPELVRALGEGDDKTVQARAHSLKSAARALGAMDFGNLMEEIEVQARSGCISDADYLAARVSICHGELLVALDRTCAELQSQRQ